MLQLHGSLCCRGELIQSEEPKHRFLYIQIGFIPIQNGRQQSFGSGLHLCGRCGYIFFCFGVCDLFYHARKEP